MRRATGFLAALLWVLPAAAGESDPRDRIAAAIGLSLPGEARVVAMAEDGAIDSVLAAKLVMPPEAAERLLARVGLTETGLTDRQRYLLGSDRGGYDPDSVPVLPTGQVRLAPGRVLNLGLDRRDPERWVVYLLWHTT